MKRDASVGMGAGGEAMRSCSSDIERLIPSLRQVARALVDKHRADIADDLVHEALEETLRGDRGWSAGEAEVRLFARLIGANRLRLRAEAGERRTLPGISARGEGSASRSGPAAPPARADGGQGLDGLTLGDREALLLVVLARLDYAKAADVLGIPIGTLIARLTHARDSLGTSLWATSAGMPRTRAVGPHLRLVKS